MNCLDPLKYWSTDIFKLLSLQSVIQKQGV